MAKLLKTPYPLTRPSYEMVRNGNYDQWRTDAEKNGAEFDELYKKSEVALQKGETVGTIFSYAVADGAAFYLVTKEKPLTLQWIPYGDCWQAPEYVIRGLRLKDLR